MDTTLGKDINSAGDRAKLDEICNRLVANKYIISYVMRDCMWEYRDCTIEDIIQRYIEGTPAVSSVLIDQDDILVDPGRVQGMSTDDKSLAEGNIFYDIKFSAKVPKQEDDGEDVRLIIVLEDQLDFYPGYSLLKRGAYYCARSISAQKGTVFTGHQYGKIQKVYVVFVCMMPPKYAQNTITRYAVQEENIVGKFHAKREDYDLASVVMVCLGCHERKENDLLRLLNVLLSQELTPTAKKQILADDYRIPMTRDIEKGVENMGSLWDRAVGKGMQQGVAKGIQQGIDEGTLNCLLGYIRRKNVPVDNAMEDLDIPLASRQRYMVSLNKMLGLGV